MPVYQLQPAAFRIVRKRIVTQMTVIGAGVLVFLLLQEYWAGNRGHSSPGSVVMVIILVIGVFGFTVYRNLTQQKAVWKSFRLYTGEDYIVRTQKSLPDIQIKRTEITEIVRAADGSLLIKTHDKRNFIAVPPYILSYPGLLTDLAGYSPIKPQPKVPFYLRYPMALTLAILGLMALFFLSQQPLLVIGTGVILLALLTWSLVEIQRSNHYDKTFKIRAYLVLIPALAILARVYLTLKAMVF